MDAETVAPWLAADEGEHTKFQVRNSTLGATSEATDGRKCDD
jgi:hypothetical protein